MNKRQRKKQATPRRVSMRRRRLWFSSMELMLEFPKPTNMWFFISDHV